MCHKKTATIRRKSDEHCVLYMCKNGCALSNLERAARTA